MYGFSRVTKATHVIISFIQTKHQMSPPLTDINDYDALSILSFSNFQSAETLIKTN